MRKGFPIVFTKASLRAEPKISRYGMNGQESVDEVSGSKSHYIAEFWMYDSRIGRRWNIDPIVKPWESPYATFSNNPILFIDPNGKDTIYSPDGRGHYAEDNYWTSLNNGEYLVGKTNVLKYNAESQMYEPYSDNVFSGETEWYCNINCDPRSSLGQGFLTQQETYWDGSRTQRTYTFQEKYFVSDWVEKDKYASELANKAVGTVIERFVKRIFKRFSKDNNPLDPNNLSNKDPKDNPNFISPVTYVIKSRESGYIAPVRYWYGTVAYDIMTGQYVGARFYGLSEEISSAWTREHFVEDALFQRVLTADGVKDIFIMTISTFRFPMSTTNEKVDNPPLKSFGEIDYD